MKLRVVAVVLASWQAAGCVPSELPQMPDPDTGAEACGAADLQYLVGQAGSVLHGMRFSQEVRVIQPGMAVTMDYKAERLNIHLDEWDVIELVSCG